MFTHCRCKVLLTMVLCVSCIWQAGVQAAQTDHIKIIRLATTTSTENSGLLHTLLPHFTAATGYKVHVIAVGTGKALRMGQDGDVDVVLVHAPAAENKFITAGYGNKRYPVMYNDFVILGPANDPAAIATARNAADALRRIANQSAIFISRGDDSGTHKKRTQLVANDSARTQGQLVSGSGSGYGQGYSDGR